MTSPAREAELARALAEVEGRLVAACAAVGRRREEVTLVAVTKTWPISDAAALVGLGVADLGEARDVEAAEKVAALAEPGRAPQSHPISHPGGAPQSHPIWHMVGQVQSRKASSVARWASVVHSVDRPRLVSALGRAAVGTGRELGVFVQVDLEPAREGGGGPTIGERGRRGGAAPGDVIRLCDTVAGTVGLRLLGLMAVAPRDDEPGAAFVRLGAMAADVRRQHPDAVSLSAGMSGDLEAAVTAGATHVRVGTALLGGRPPAPG